jgi:hypothetical protein
MPQWLNAYGISQCVIKKQEWLPLVNLTRKECRKQFILIQKIAKERGCELFFPPNFIQSINNAIDSLSDDYQRETTDAERSAAETNGSYQEHFSRSFDPRIRGLEENFDTCLGSARETLSCIKEGKEMLGRRSLFSSFKYSLAIRAKYLGYVISNFPERRDFIREAVSKIQVQHRKKFTWFLAEPALQSLQPSQLKEIRDSFEELMSSISGAIGVVEGV